MCNEGAVCKSFLVGGQRGQYSHVVFFYRERLGVGRCLGGSSSILTRLGSSRTNLRRDRTRGHLTRRNRGELTRNGGRSIFRGFLIRFSSPVVVVLVITTVISTMASTCGHRFPTSIVVVVVIILVGTILKICRRAGTRGTVSTLGRVTTTGDHIGHKNGAILVGSSVLIPNSIITLRTNSDIPTSYHVLRSTSVGTRRTTLANRSIPIRGSTSRVATTSKNSIPLNSEGGVYCVNSGVICNRNRTIIATANVGARVNGVTATVGSTASNRAPLRGGLGRLSEMLSCLILKVYIIVFYISILEAMVANGTMAFGNVLSAFVITISLTITTVPRKLTAIIAVILSVNMAGVDGHGTIIHGLATIRALNYARIVYSSGANALARGGVAMARAGNSSRGLATRTVTLYSSTTFRGNGMANRPARTTLIR